MPLWISIYEFRGTNEGGGYLVSAETRRDASQMVREWYRKQGEAPDVHSATLTAYCRRTDTDMAELSSGVTVPEPGEMESLWAGS